MEPGTLQTLARMCVHSSCVRPPGFQIACSILGWPAPTHNISRPEDGHRKTMEKHGSETGTATDCKGLQGTASLQDIFFLPGFGTDVCVRLPRITSEQVEEIEI